MKNHLKWLIPIACITVVLSCAGGYFYWRTHRIPTEISYVYSDSSIDLNNPYEVVGAKEYVFVGYVKEIHDYFTEKDSREFPETIYYYNSPFTECVVTVVKSIKGNLNEGEDFSFYKTGGITEDRQYIQLYEQDIMPEANKYYIFSGLAHQDGTMTGGGTNGTIELEEGIEKSNLAESKVYQKYVDAYKNQVIPLSNDTYPDFLATVDVNFGDGSYNKAMFEKYKIDEPEFAVQYKERLQQNMSDIS